MKIFPWLLAALISSVGQALPAQTWRTDTLPRSGAWALLEVANGDSTFLMSLPPLRITARRQFKDLEEQKLFNRYTWAAKRVYPYAVQAVNLYRDIQEETQDMSRRKRKRYVKNEHHELKEDMTERIKKLSKTEGKVLMKMIERELNMPFYDVIRSTRGTTTATYWNTMGKIWGYDLKQGYRPGDDPLLDGVFIDYDFGDPLRDIWKG
jgi:hypothetical protein